MSIKRLLFIQDDPFLGSVYRDRLENAGFTVDTARDSRAGLKMAAELKPDAVVVDPVLPEGDIGPSLQQIRLQSAGRKLPILVLPTPHPSLANSAQEAGATLMVERTQNPVQTLIAEISKACNSPMPPQEEGGATLNSHWKQATISAAPGSLVSMRTALHEVIRVPDNHHSLRDLLQKTHAFAGQMSLLGTTAVSHLADALEVLVYGLDCFPERINPLTLRTLGQAVDFLGVLYEKEMHLTPLDLSGSHVLVVEDEPNAREMIRASMDLVGLESDGLEDPATSLAVLSSQECDLIFLDINLPDMNGFEVCTKLRAVPFHEKTPIVFITGMTSFQNRVQSSLSGGSDFVGKPFNVAELGVKALIWTFRKRLGLM